MGYREKDQDKATDHPLFSSSALKGSRLGLEDCLMSGEPSHHSFHLQAPKSPFLLLIASLLIAQPHPPLETAGREKELI